MLELPQKEKKDKMVELRINYEDQHNRAQPRISSLTPGNLFEEIQILYYLFIRQVSEQEKFFEDIYVNELCQRTLFWKCKKVCIHNCFFNSFNTHKTIEFIGSSCRFLTFLSLKYNNIGDQGVKMLCEQEFIFLRNLNLAMGDITEHGAVQLSRSKWKYLQTLDLSNNQIKNKGLKYLTKNEHLESLRELTILNVGLTADCSKIVKRFPWQKLRYLSIAYWHMGSQLSKALNSSSLQLEYIFLGHSSYIYPGFEAKNKNNKNLFKYQLLRNIGIYPDRKLKNEEMNKILKLKYEAERP